MAAPAALPFDAGAARRVSGDLPRCPAPHPWTRFRPGAVIPHAICRAAPLELPSAHPRRGESGGFTAPGWTGGKSAGICRHSV